MADLVLDGVTLPADLAWADEFDWNPVGQQVSPAVTGAIIIQESAMQAGRPITLASEPDMAWVLRSVVEALYAKASTLNKVMTLTLPDGRGFSVRFRRDGGSPITAKPVVLKVPSPDDWYTVSLRLITVGGV